MLRGFTTLNYYVDDVPAAVSWYTKVLGVAPYFASPTEENPAYVEFRVGDDEDELGLIDSRYRPSGAEVGRPTGAVMYWQVDDVRAACDVLLGLGATELEPPTERGELGWVTATVTDPFGNIIGLMYSPHYLALHS